MWDVQDINILSITIRLGLAVLFGGIIGMNRGRKKMPAGFRTHILVCMGAALTMMTNQYVCQEIGGSDPVRMGAQVISGIGFLGAGTIMVTGGNKVKGLTTAASLWASGCMGLAIGIGMYHGAIIACIYMLFVMSVLQKLDEVMANNSRIMSIYIEFKEIENVSYFMRYIKEKKIRIMDLDISHIGEQGESHIIAIVTIKLNKSMGHKYILDEISSCKGVRYIHEM